MSVFKKFNIYVIDIDQIFIESNKKTLHYINGLGITLDPSQKDFKKLFIHFLLTSICNFIITYPYNYKLIFYSDIRTKDEFQNKLIKKIKKIFGFKIWEGESSHMEFLELLKNKDVGIIDAFELFLQNESKPKTFKHIKKYLEQEGFKALNDTYFKDLANKMIVCG